MIRLLIVDDHEIVRHGLKLALSQVEGMQVVGEAADGSEALTLIYDLVPDVVLLDWKMPQLDGLKTAQQIKAEMGTARTLVLSGAPLESAVLDALEDGVDGFVHKDISPRNLVHAIRRVAAGERYLGAEVTRALIARSQRPRMEERTPTLSEREQEVLELMATAATYKEIAAQLFISLNTVRFHVKSLYGKLNVNNRLEAISKARALGVLPTSN